MRITFLIFFCLLSSTLFGQTPQQIEADLLKSFKKIGYWDDRIRTNTKGDTSLEDSLEKANDVFVDKIKYYTASFPSTINQDFKSLKKERLDIFTSADGLFRVYSWETWQGGTMRDFANIYQYKTGQQPHSVYLHNLGPDGPYIPFYTNLYTYKIAGKTYYLGVYGCIYSNKDAGTGIRVFDIENGKLNDDVKIIKTASGLHSKLYYDYNFFSVVDIPFEKRPTITFNAQKETISVPLVNANGNVTHNFITYKFNGQYFERVKN